MKLDSLISFFSHSAAAKLLRSPNAAHIVHFLHQQFKCSGSITAAHSTLVQRLSSFQEEVHSTADDVLRDRAETYLTNWSTGDTRWLRRFHDVDFDEPVYELTPHTEDVLKFLSEVVERNLGFVGTESRLKRIIDTLTDIVVRGSADPGRRLEHLAAERDRIEREMRAIEAGEVVETYGPTAIRERFADAVSNLASLQGDFRAVEESFKKITRDVQKRQSSSADSRGDILGFALDAEDSLKSQDQGVSFDEFVRLVLSPSKQDELESIVARLDEIELLAKQADGMQRIRGMMGSLSDEAEKVLRTTRRLSSTIRRLLDTRAGASRQRLAAVLQEIRAAATRLADRTPPSEAVIEIFTQLDLMNATERSFWTAPIEFEEAELTDHPPNEDDRVAAFLLLAKLQRLDWAGMKQNVSSALRGDVERISLAELLKLHPAASGAIEILGYIQIAHDGGHEVDDSQIETIQIESSASDIERFEIPKVIFLSERLRALRNAFHAGERGA